MACIPPGMLMAGDVERSRKSGYFSEDGNPVESFVDWRRSALDAIGFSGTMCTCGKLVGYPNAVEYLGEMGMILRRFIQVDGRMGISMNHLFVGEAMHCIERRQKVLSIPKIGCKFSLKRPVYEDIDGMEVERSCPLMSTYTEDILAASPIKVDGVYTLRLILEESVSEEVLIEEEFATDDEEESDDAECHEKPAEGDHDVVSSGDDEDSVTSGCDGDVSESEEEPTFDVGDVSDEENKERKIDKFAGDVGTYGGMFRSVELIKTLRDSVTFVGDGWNPRGRGIPPKVVDDLVCTYDQRLYDDGAEEVWRYKSVGEVAMRKATLKGVIGDTSEFVVFQPWFKGWIIDSTCAGMWGAFIKDKILTDRAYVVGRSYAELHTSIMCLRGGFHPKFSDEVMTDMRRRLVMNMNATVAIGIGVLTGDVGINRRLQMVFPVLVKPKRLRKGFVNDGILKWDGFDKELRGFSLVGSHAVAFVNSLHFVCKDSNVGELKVSDCVFHGSGTSKLVERKLKAWLGFWFICDIRVFSVRIKTLLPRCCSSNVDKLFDCSVT